MEAKSEAAHLADHAPAVDGRAGVDDVQSHGLRADLARDEDLKRKYAAASAEGRDAAAKFRAKWAEEAHQKFISLWELEWRLPGLK